MSTRSDAGIGNAYRTKEYVMRSPRSRVAAWVFVAFAGAALFLLVSEHHAHGVGPWLYLLLVFCPLLLYLNGWHAEQLDKSVEPPFGSGGSARERLATGNDDEAGNAHPPRV
jgi:hypothetical protein